MLQTTESQRHARRDGSPDDEAGPLEDDERSMPKARVLRHPLLSLKEHVFHHLGLKHVAGFVSRREAIERRVEEIPARMQKATDQARLAIELIDDFWRGSYREVGWRTIAIAAGALLYCASPGDVVPDVLPLLGTLDDILVVRLAIHFIGDELKAYCVAKGYDPARYF